MSKGVAQSQDCIFFLMLILLQLLDVGLSYFCLASFPCLPRLRFLIACSMQKLSQFLHTGSDQKPEPGKAWERGYFCYAWLKERMTLLECAVYPFYVHLTSMYITICDEFF